MVLELGMDPLQFGFGLGLGLGSSMNGSQSNGMASPSNPLNSFFGGGQLANQPNAMDANFMGGVNTGASGMAQDPMTMMFMASSQMLMSMMGMFQMIMGMYQQFSMGDGLQNPMMQNAQIQNGLFQPASTSAGVDPSTGLMGGFDASNAGSGVLNTGGMLGGSVAWAQQLLAEDKARLTAKGASGASDSSGSSTSSRAASDRPGTTPAVAAPNTAAAGTLKGITPNQFELGDPDGGSMCGIVAAAAFAKSAGKDISIPQIKEFAINQGGWTADAGMGGSIGEVAMLNAMGVSSHEEGLDWNKVIETVQSGKPVIITSPRHYLVVEGYDPATGKLDFGNSAGILRATGGETQFTIDEAMAGAFGDGRVPDGAIYMD